MRVWKGLVPFWLSMVSSSGVHTASVDRLSPFHHSGLLSLFSNSNDIHYSFRVKRGKENERQGLSIRTAFLSFVAYFVVLDSPVFLFSHWNAVF